MREDCGKRVLGSVGLLGLLLGRVLILRLPESFRLELELMG